MQVTVKLHKKEIRMIIDALYNYQTYLLDIPEMFGNSKKITKYNEELNKLQMKLDDLEG